MIYLSNFALSIVSLLIVLNLIFWPRKSKKKFSKEIPTFSLLIPMRNEEHRLNYFESNLERLSDQFKEVIVYDDQSTDQTAEKLGALSNPKLKVISGCVKPDTWNGKIHACFHLAQASTADIKLFIDADVIL